MNVSKLLTLKERYINSDLSIYLACVGINNSNNLIYSWNSMNKLALKLINSS